MKCKGKKCFCTFQEMAHCTKQLASKVRHTVSSRITVLDSSANSWNVCACFIKTEKFLHFP